MIQSKTTLLIATAVAVVIGILVFRSEQELEEDPAADSGAAQGQSPLPSGSKNPPGSANTPSPIEDQSGGAIPPKYFGQAPLPLNLDAPPFERHPNGKTLKKDVARRLADLNDSSRDPIEDIETLTSVIASYRKIFRENPIAGENREVVEALTGKNPYELMLIDPAHPAINAKGELVDRWNVPYRFHPFSRNHMEILSAGADKQFGTGDDVMIEDPLEFGNPPPPKEEEE